MEGSTLVFSTGDVREVGGCAYLILLSMLSLTVACGRAETRRARPTDVYPGDPLIVEWGPCAGVRTGPVCELDRQRKLTVWVGNSDNSRWSIATEDGRVADQTKVEVDAGTRLTLNVPAGARQVRLEDAGGGIRWSLAIGTAHAHEQIDEIVTLGRSGKYEDALGMLERLRASVPAEDRGPTDAAIGRMALALGKIDRAESAFRSSISAAQTEGRLVDVVKDGAALLWALVHLRQRYVDARALLAEMATAGEQYPEGRVWLEYHAGLLAADTGDIRTALERYRRAERAARRLGLKKLGEDSTMEIARLLTRIGRTEEALSLLGRLPTPTDPCARATLALNLAWARMEHEALQTSPDGEQKKAAAIDAAEQATQECPNPHLRLQAIVYAVEQALKSGDDAGVRRLIQQPEFAAVDRDVLRASRREEVLGRWLLRQKKPAAALATFDSHLPAALSLGLLEEAFRAEVGSGRALLALGRRTAAVSRLRAAQDLLERFLRGVPFAEGRGSFLSGRDEGVRYLVEALVDSGSVREALRAARLARASELTHAARLDRLAGMSLASRRQWDEAVGRYQYLRSEIERDAGNEWTIPQADIGRRRSERQAQAEKARAALDDAYGLLLDGKSPQELKLAEPGPGEVFLAFSPGPRGWFAFAVTTSEVIVRRISDADLSSQAAAEIVLGLFGSQIASAHRVRLLLYGPADRLDWQTVSLRGRPLLSFVEVEHGLDLGTEGRQRPANELPATALVVSNPTGDLPAAIPESDAVVRVLTGWQVRRLDGPAATRDALLAALPGARLLHYAGHAQVSQSGDFSSALLLEGGTRVELGDLLTSPSVPEVIVLPACEAAGTIEGGRSSMGLAQAFLAAGSRVAIAPVRRVGDQDAAAFVGEFYGALVQEVAHNGQVSAAPRGSLALSERVPAAFRSAALALLSRRGDVAALGHQGGVGWESFRLLVP